MSYLINMLPEDIEKAVRENWKVIIPSGCIELHGNHLPLGTDLILVEEVIKRFEPYVKVVVTPAFSFGPTGYAVGGPETGTIDVRANSFKEYAKDVLQAMYEMGFRHFIVIQHHQGTDGPSGTAFKMAAGEIFNDLKTSNGNGWYTKNYGEKSQKIKFKVDVKPLVFNPCGWGGHGARGETEPMMVFRPETVFMEKLKVNDFPWNWNPGKEASLADAEIGKKIAEVVVRDWINFLSDK